MGTQEAPNYVLMGSGFNTIDENPSAQTDSRIYINEKAATTTIKSYQTQFPFDTDLMKSEEAVMALYDIGRIRKLVPMRKWITSVWNCSKSRKQRK